MGETTPKEGRKFALEFRGEFTGRWYRIRGKEDLSQWKAQSEARSYREKGVTVRVVEIGAEKKTNA